MSTPLSCKRLRGWKWSSRPMVNLLLVCRLPASSIISRSFSPSYQKFRGVFISHYFQSHLERTFQLESFSLRVSTREFQPESFNQRISDWKSSTFWCSPKSSVGIPNFELVQFFWSDSHHSRQFTTYLAITRDFVRVLELWESQIETETYRLELAGWNFQIGAFGLELSGWSFETRTYKLEPTSQNLQPGAYKPEFTSQSLQARAFRDWELRDF